MLWEANQAQVFLAMVYAGLAMGVCYDLLRLLRLLLRAGPVLTALFDLLFWLLAAALAACAAALCGALEAAVPGPWTTHASITARPFFEARGYRVVRAKQVERHGVLLTNFVMEKPAPPAAD